MTSQTPSRSTSSHQPIESPFPLSPLNQSPSSHGLSQRHLQEIQTIFRIFDPNLHGYIDCRTFEVLTRSLGLRMTAVQVRAEVEMAWEERLAGVETGEEQYQQQHGRERCIDLPMVISILVKRGYGKQRSVLDEVRMYFRLLDRDNKGYVTLEDLTRVQAEIESTRNELREEMGDLDVLRFKSVGDATLKVMIDVFDVNKDGVIDLEEFCRIVEPILS
ncbi:hypothetical protein ACHAXN_008721 [Cyclotella atomus]